MVTNNPHQRSTLPVELSYQILEEAWRLPLSTTERRDLLIALPLVCTSFRWIASRLFLQDAHVFSSVYATHLLSLLQRRCDRLPNHSIRVESPSKSFTDAPANNTLHCNCWRSITFHIYGDPSSSSPNLLHLHPPSSNPMTKESARHDFTRPITRYHTRILAAPHRTSLHRLVLQRTSSSTHA